MRRHDGLTMPEKLFVHEFLVDLNESAAALRAGCKDRRRGNIIAKRPHVRLAIQRAMNSRAKRINMTADKVLEGIERIATAAEAAEKYNEALKAYELLGKHLKLFTDKIELSGSVALAERLKEARERISSR